MRAHLIQLLAGLVASQIPPPCNYCTPGCSRTCGVNEYVSKLAVYYNCEKCPSYTSGGGCSGCQLVTCGDGMYNFAHSCRKCNSLIVRKRGRQYGFYKQCQPFRDCFPGNKVKSWGSNTQDRECERCEEGTYQDEKNRATCKPQVNCSGQIPFYNGTTAVLGRCCQLPDGDILDSNGAFEACCPADHFAIPRVHRNNTNETCCRHDQYAQLDADGNFVACTNISDACAAPLYFQSQNPTRTSDRACRLRCNPRWYYTKSDGECVIKSTTCRKNTYISANATLTSDIVCTRCPPKTWSDEGPNYDCQPFNCTPGTRINYNWVTPDSKCVDCQRSSFTNVTNLDECTPWSDCPPGQEQTKIGTSTTDRVCSACSYGKYNGRVNSRCSNWWGCWDSKRVGTATENINCCGGGRMDYYEVATFAPGTNDTLAINVTCMPRTWEDCPAGQYFPDPSYAMDNVCKPPPKGYYVGGPFTSWRYNDGKYPYYVLRELNNCTRLQYVSAAPTATSNRECRKCPGIAAIPPDVDPNNATQRDCVPVVANCTPGSGSPEDIDDFSNWNQTTMERKCYPCPNGTYSPGGNTECKRWYSCEGRFAKQFQVSAPNSTHDYGCVKCPKGSSAAENATSVAECQMCPAGKYADFWNRCKDCRPGTIAPNAGSEECERCSDLYQYALNATRCVDCPAGKYRKYWYILTCSYDIPLSTKASASTSLDSLSADNGEPLPSTTAPGLPKRAGSDASASSTRGRDAGIAVGVILAVMVLVGAAVYSRHRVATKNKTAADDMFYPNPTYEVDTNPTSVA